MWSTVRHQRFSDARVVGISGWIFGVQDRNGRSGVSVAICVRTRVGVGIGMRIVIGWIGVNGGSLILLRIRFGFRFFKSICVLGGILIWIVHAGDRRRWRTWIRYNPQVRIRTLLGGSNSFCCVCITASRHRSQLIGWLRSNCLAPELIP